MGSPLGDLRDALARKREERHLDLVVPCLDDVEDGVYVRYAPRVTAERVGELEKLRRGEERRTGVPWEIPFALDMLIESCIGVYVRSGDQRVGFCDGYPDDPAKWPRFSDASSEDIAALLPDDLDTSSSEARFRALFECRYAPADARAAAEADISRHLTRLRRFLDGDQPTGEELRGESSPTRR